MTEKVFVSAESLLRDSRELAVRIVRSGFRPTFRVALWRGGAHIGITVQEVLEYHGIHTDHVAIRTSRETEGWLVFPHEIQGLTREEILAQKPVDPSFFEV